MEHHGTSWNTRRHTLRHTLSIVFSGVVVGVRSCQESTGVVLNRSAPEIVSCARRRLEEALLEALNLPLDKHI